LALVIEAAPEDGVPAQIIRELGVQALGEVIELPMWRSIWGAYWRGINVRLRSCANGAKKGWRDFL